MGYEQGEGRSKGSEGGGVNREWCESRGRGKRRGGEGRKERGLREGA